VLAALLPTAPPRPCHSPCPCPLNPKRLRFRCSLPRSDFRKGPPVCPPRFRPCREEDEEEAALRTGKRAFFIWRQDPYLFRPSRLPLARGQVATPTREEFIGNHPGNSDGMSTPSRVREGNSSHKTAQNRTPITGKPRSSWISWT